MFADDFGGCHVVFGGDDFANAVLLIGDGFLDGNGKEDGVG